MAPTYMSRLMQAHFGLSALNFALIKCSGFYFPCGFTDLFTLCRVQEVNNLITKRIFGL